MVILILGQHLSTAVYDVVHGSKAPGKGILMFLKDVLERNEDLKRLIAEADIKYARFSTVENFAIS